MSCSLGSCAPTSLIGRITSFGLRVLLLLQLRLPFCFAAGRLAFGEVLQLLLVLLMLQCCLQRQSVSSLASSKEALELVFVFELPVFPTSCSRCGSFRFLLVQRRRWQALQFY